MKARLLRLCFAAALALGGWGGALAAALCTHAGVSHDCHAQSAEASHNAGAHSNHGEQEQTHGESCEGVAASSAREESFCTHCVGRSGERPPQESPASRQSGRSHQSINAAALHLSASKTPPFFSHIAP